jgi:hypothetical protein
MKKILLFSVIALALLHACKKDDQYSTVSGRFEIITNKSSVDGNLVLGLVTTSSNTFTLVTKNVSKATSAIISTDTVNGLYINPTTIALGDSVKVPLSGTPVIDGVFNLSVKVNIGGTIYICTKEFYVDLPNITAILSTMATDTTVNNVIDSSKINFEINPYTTAFTIVVPPHLTAQITSTSRTSRILTLYADNQFMSGDVVITGNFRSVTPLINTLHVSTFAGGDGTTGKPFQIADTARLSKIQYAADKNYQLTANITAPKTVLSNLTLIGSIDGNGKTISNYVLNSNANNAGFLAAIATTGSVKNLSFSNISVTGKDYTGGLTAINNGTVTNVTVAGNVTGANYVAAIAGNNFGTINSCDASNASVSGVNYMATFAGNTNSGSTQTANVVLSAPATFPTESYGLSGTKNVSFAFTPTTGTIVVQSVPTGFTTSVIGQTVTLNAPAGFVSGAMQLSLQSGKLSCTRSLILYSKQAGAVFDAGDGSSANPFIMSTEAAFDSIINAPSKYYQLAANINLTKTWITIPAFSGSIDGKGFKVNGLLINAATANNGLTGTNTGTIKNIQFLNVNCTTSGNTFGVMGGTQNAGTLQNVIVSGVLTSTALIDTLGGLVGTLTNGAKITQCYAKLTITAACGMVGGLVGCLTATTTPSEISFSTTAGSIEITASKTRVGGILGRAAGLATALSGGIIKNCISTMDIKSSGANGAGANGFGGIMGADQNAGIVPIDQCMFAGTVTAGFSIGGIAGVGSNITNCIVAGQGAALTTPTLFANGASPSVGSVGGIAGTDKNLLQFCIVKNVTLSATVTSPGLGIAGIASTYQNNGNTSKSFVVNTSITGSPTAPNGENAFRISGTAANGTGVNGSNYVGSNVSTPSRTGALVDNAAGLDGQSQTSAPLSFFTGLGFSTSIWKTDTDGYPTLVNVGYNGGYTLP